MRKHVLQESALNEWAGAAAPLFNPVSLNLSCSGQTSDSRSTETQAIATKTVQRFNVWLLKSREFPVQGKRVLSGKILESSVGGGGFLRTLHYTSRWTRLFITGGGFSHLSIKVNLNEEGI